MVEATQRVVPGAPQQMAKPSGKKKKQQQQTAQPRQDSSSLANNSHKQDAVSRAATEASLVEKAPSRDKIDESVKIQVKDLAEEAERNGAIAAVDIVKQKESLTQEKESKSPLQLIISKRVKVLTKKLQRAVMYEALEEAKLNEDMKRIIASKSALEGGIAELTEAAKAMEIAEQESAKQMEAASKLAAARAKQEDQEEHNKKNVVLFQFLHLHSLTQPGSVHSFAPRPLPASLEQATSQEVAAVGKLFADLSSSPQVVPQDDKNTLVAKLASGSKDEVLTGVTFERILCLIQGISTSSVELSSAGAVAPEVEATLAHSPTLATVAPASGISFVQESEIDDSGNVLKAPLEATNEIKQAEPEGGSTHGVPVQEIAGGATDRGEAGGKGILLGEITSSGKAVEDGSALAEINEPIQTTVVGGHAVGGNVDLVDPVSTAERSATSTSTPKKIDWAADDDDWGDMPMQPTSSRTVTAKEMVAPVELAAALSSQKEHTAMPASARGIQANGVHATSETKSESKSGPQSGPLKGQGAPVRETKHPQKQNGQIRNPAPAPAKILPEVDEDGFVVASSKRSKMLQQQQQASARGGSRGGRNGNPASRGSFRGGNAMRGGGLAGRGGGGVFTDARGRGRGRGMRQESEQAS